MNQFFCVIVILLFSIGRSQDEEKSLLPMKFPREVKLIGTFEKYKRRQTGWRTAAGKTWKKVTPAFLFSLSHDGINHHESRVTSA